MPGLQLDQPAEQVLVVRQQGGDFTDSRQGQRAGYPGLDLADARLRLIQQGGETLFGIGSDLLRQGRLFPKPDFPKASFQAPDFPVGDRSGFAMAGADGQLAQKKYDAGVAEGE